MVKYRNLSEVEITRLISQKCSCDQWELITVAPSFTVEQIENVHFSGNIQLGVFEKKFSLAGGFEKKSGIKNATLHNCHIGNNVLIENISNYIANYEIEEDSFIQNVNLLIVTGETSFGNGIEVSVLNETGGREVPIYNDLSAHLAYIIALYRHHPILITKLREMIAKYAHTHRSDRGHIGKKVTITNCSTLKNICVGDCATINGATRLENGTLNSNASDPVFIGYNVMAEDFIISSGAYIGDSVVLKRCFIGQACRLSHLFSAHDSLFFSNCVGENGEACAIFAGPYTVSMHKSSLLIAGMFSFLNAGSGSNQSNHMYKLGPIHQGIVERGSKTTSDSYILWPAKIGAFSLVMGRHVQHPDTSDLPFSYLLEKSNQTYLVPGVNLKSVGTIRDAQKWPKRDNRKDTHQLDYINFNLLSPYTIRKMLKGIEVLRSLQKTSGMTSEEYAYRSARITNCALEKGISLYAKAIHKFLGNSIIKRLESINFTTNHEIQERLNPTHTAGSGEWIDLSGLIAPKAEIEALIQGIEKSSINTLNKITEIFEKLHKDYYEMEWKWAAQEIEKWYGVSLSTITASQVTEIVTYWKEAVTDLDKMLYNDAQKEFSITSQIGFGVDGDDLQQQQDFIEVRGDFENNPFVTAVKHHIKEKSALGDELISRMKTIKD